MTLPLVISEVAADLDVSTAAAGQLRTVTCAVAGVVSLAVAAYGARFGLRRLLVTGVVLLVAGCVASAAAPSFATLCAAQVLMGASVALLVSGAGAAAVQWATPEERPRMLAWSLIGQPAAWVVGMPASGVLSEAGWRLSLAVPAAAALVTLFALTRVPRGGVAAGALGLRAVLRDASLARWMTGEVLAFAAWGATLLFAGAMLVERAGARLSVAAAILGAGAIFYLPGNLLVRRWMQHHAAHAAVGGALVTGTLGAVFFVVPMDLAPAAVLFAAIAFAGGGRTLAGSAAGLHAPEALRTAVMSVRGAAMQFGFLIGGALGGAALAVGGYGAVGAAVAILFVAAVLPHVTLQWRFAAIRRPWPAGLAGAPAVSLELNVAPAGAPSARTLRFGTSSAQASSVPR